MFFGYGTYSAKDSDALFSYGLGTPIIGGWSPSEVTDVTAWYYLEPDGLSNGQIINTVTDLSGAGAENLTQPSASLQPTYDIATGGWATTPSGGNLLGASLVDWKFLHGGAASVTVRAAFDVTQNTYFLNTQWGPNPGTGVTLQWIGVLGRWYLRIGDAPRGFVPTSLPNSEQMYVITYTWAADGSAKIYLDGAEVATWAAGSFVFDGRDQASPFVLGSSYLSGIGSSNITMTDVIVGTEYVDATQALALYHGLNDLRS